VLYNHRSQVHIMSVPVPFIQATDTTPSLEVLMEMNSKLQAENNVLRANEVTFNELAAQRLFMQRAMTGNAFGEVNTDPSNRDYYGQFGYPQRIDREDYQRLFNRNPLASRVVRAFPTECWQTHPEIFDRDAPSESAFETEVRQLVMDHNVWGTLERADILSGIGAYGIIVFGLDDDAPMDSPVVGYEEGTCNHNLLFLRVFPHSMVRISSFCTDPTSPRYGNPEIYSIQQRPMVDFEVEVTGEFSTLNVHWSRVLHVADNRETSEIFGVPRLQLVYNILLDVEKVLGCSGEMFYKGTYPGYAVTTKNVGMPQQFNSEELERKFAELHNGYQRFIGLQNADITALPSMYSEPSGLLDQYVQMIAIALGIPDRILKGSERGELASGQDAVLWNARVQGRRDGYCVPCIVRPFINRLVRYGAVKAAVNNDYSIEWKGSESQDPLISADYANKLLNNLQLYASNDLQRFIAPKDFLIKFMQCTDDEAATLLVNAQTYTQEQALLMAATTAGGDASSEFTL